MKTSASQNKAIRNQQVHTGPAGLNIPELPEDASDDEIIAALANLEAAQTKLAGLRRALAEEADSLLCNAPQIADELAALRSNQIKGILKKSNMSITDMTGIGDL